MKKPKNFLAEKTGKATKPLHESNFKMMEKSKKSTKPIHEPNFLNWTKTGKIDKTPVFQLVSWTKKEKYDSRIGHTSFSFWQAREAYRFLFGDRPLQ